MVKLVSLATDSDDPLSRLQDDFSGRKILVRTCSSRSEQFLVSIVDLEPDA